MRRSLLPPAIGSQSSLMGPNLSIGWVREQQPVEVVALDLEATQELWKCSVPAFGCACRRQASLRHRQWQPHSPSQLRAHQRSGQTGEAN